MIGQPDPGSQPGNAVTGEESVVGSDDGGQPSAPETRFVGGRLQSWDETIQNYEASRAEVERWKAIAEERAAREVSVAPPTAGPALPAWASRMVDLGVPVDVVREQVEWQTQLARSEGESRAAAKVQELVNGLAEISTAEGQADAALSREFDGYSKDKLEGFLATNSAAKSRYDKVYKADPESAKRLAWLEATGGAGPKGQPRHTEVPTGRRPISQGKKEDFEALKAAAMGGNDDRATIAYMKALMRRG